MNVDHSLASTCSQHLKHAVKRSFAPQDCLYEALPPLLSFEPAPPTLTFPPWILFWERLWIIDPSSHSVHWLREVILLPLASNLHVTSTVGWFWWPWVVAGHAWGKCKMWLAALAIKGSSFLCSIFLILVMTTLENGCLNSWKASSTNNICGRFLQKLLETNTLSALSNFRVTSYKLSSNNHYHIAETKDLSQKPCTEPLHKAVWIPTQLTAHTPPANWAMFPLVFPSSPLYEGIVYLEVPLQVLILISLPYSKRVSDAARAAGENDSKMSD